MDLTGGVEGLGEAAQAIAAHFKSIWLPIQVAVLALAGLLSAALGALSHRTNPVPKFQVPRPTPAKTNF